jgi:site-specific DNA recombinase
MAKRTRQSMAAGNAGNPSVQTANEPATAVETPRKPLAGYLRLTVDRDGNKIGYDVQQKAITHWAAANGFTIGEWYKDKDLTAADSKVIRPDYERMLGDIESKRWAGVVVWRLDRLVRLTSEFERCNSIMEEAGAFILSIDPPVDTRNDMGKFVMRLLVMLAEMEISAMKARSRAHHKAKAEAGKHKGGGSRAFGFVGPEYDEHGNLLNKGRHGVEHIAEEADLIREAARRIAWENESYADIIRDWSTRNPPVVGPNGSVFHTTALTAVLTNPRMIGLRTHTTIDPSTKEPVTNVYRAEWEPILDKPTFERLEALRAVRTPGKPFQFNLTGGIVICGRCGKRLVGTRITTGKGATARKVPGYRCEPSATARVQGSCGKGSVIADPVDKLVVGMIAARLATNSEDLTSVRNSASGHDAEIAETLEAISECDVQLDQLKLLSGLPLSEGGIDLRELPGYRAPWLRRREEATEKLDRLRAVKQVPHPIGREWEDVWTWFSALSVKQRRAFIRTYVRSVTINPATSRGFFDKSRVDITFTDAQEGDAGR